MPVPPQFIPISALTIMIEQLPTILNAALAQ